MSYILFIFWLVVLSYWLGNIRFVKNAGLNNRLIYVLFISKVVAGVASGWISHSHADSDSWHFHQDGVIEYHLLFNNPKEYFTNLFYTGYSYGYDGFLQVQNSYWNDLKSNLIIKLLSVLDVFSGGNYYVNVVLFNFLIFFGFTGLYRVFDASYQADKRLTAAVVFLLPSVLFFGSTIHKDGLILGLTGVVVFNVWKMLNQQKLAASRVLYILLSLAIIFLFRTFVALALLPALFSWVLCYKKNLSPIKTFAAVYAANIILFFTVPYIMPAANLPAYMVNRQADFIHLPNGNTTIQLDSLQPNPLSFATVAPQALQHSLLRPFISDIKLSRLLLPLALEVLLYELLFVVFLFFRRKDFPFNQPFLLFSLFFGFSLCLAIGYTVPVIGAIVRYRSIYLPFVMAPFLLAIDWRKLLSIAQIKK